MVSFRSPGRPSDRADRGQERSDLRLGDQPRRRGDVRDHACVCDRRAGAFRHRHGHGDAAGCYQSANAHGRWGSQLPLLFGHGAAGVRARFLCQSVGLPGRHVNCRAPATTCGFRPGSAKPAMGHTLLAVPRIVRRRCGPDIYHALAARRTAGGRAGRRRCLLSRTLAPTTRCGGFSSGSLAMSRPSRASPTG